MERPFKKFDQVPSAMLMVGDVFTLRTQFRKSDKKRLIIGIVGVNFECIHPDTNKPMPLMHRGENMVIYLGSREL